MTLFIDKTLREFNDMLKSNEPAPGGGSSAALSGMLGTALSMMVVNLSVGKKAYEALDEGIKKNIGQNFEIIQKLNTELMELMEEDTRAFNAFMAATKLKKETEEEKAVRADALHKASLYVLEVPLKVAEKCLEIMKNQMAIVRYGNKNAVSDIGVGIILAYAGLEGAVLNVRINLPGINDAAIKSDAEEKIEGFLKEGAFLKETLMALVRERIGG